MTFAPVAYEQVLRQMVRWLDAGFGRMWTGSALCAHLHWAQVHCSLAGRPCGSLVQRSAGASTDGWDGDSGDSGEREEGRMPKRACSGHMCTCNLFLFNQNQAL